jgi:uncharacterized membrane protein YccC
MSILRPTITHFTAFLAGAAIAGPFALAFHADKGIEAGDWLNLPNTVIGAIIGGLVTYALQPKSASRGGRAAVHDAMKDLRAAAERTESLSPDQIVDDEVLAEAQANARRLSGAAERYQYARALTPPEETLEHWIDVDDAVQELRAALRDAERSLARAAEAHGPELLRRHLQEVKDRFGAPLVRLTQRAGA